MKCQISVRSRVVQATCQAAAVESSATRRQIHLDDLGAGGFDHFERQFHHFRLQLLHHIILPLRQTGRLGCFNLAGGRLGIVTLEWATLTNIRLVVLVLFCGNQLLCFLHLLLLLNQSFLVTLSDDLIPGILLPFTHLLPLFVVKFIFFFLIF